MGGGMSGVAGQMPAAHKPTLGYTVVLVIGAFVVYHLVAGKKR
jgi:hypothetical protein